MEEQQDALRRERIREIKTQAAQKIHTNREVMEMALELYDLREQIQPSQSDTTENLVPSSEAIKPKHYYWQKRLAMERLEQMNAESVSRWQNGKVMTEAERQSISASLAREIKYYQFLEAVLERDRYTCQHCGITQQELNIKFPKPFIDGDNPGDLVFRRLIVHEPYGDPRYIYHGCPESGYDLYSGLTLCHSCSQKHWGRQGQ